MPRSDHPSNSWEAQRHYLNAALKHLSAFTDNMRTFLEIGDEQADAANPLTLVLDYTTTSDTIDERPPTKQTSPRDRYPNTRRPWTPFEDNLLLSGIKLEMPLQEIAQALGRTTAACDRRQRTIAEELSNGPF
jgi:hypothetical protein